MIQTHIPNTKTYRLYIVYIYFEFTFSLMIVTQWSPKCFTKRQTLDE